jgi:hypothetical protein
MSIKTERIPSRQDEDVEWGMAMADMLGFLPDGPDAPIIVSLNSDGTLAGVASESYHQEQVALSGRTEEELAAEVDVTIHHLA